MKIFKFKSFLSPLSLGEGSGVRPLGLFLLASLFLACLFLASCSQEVASGNRNNSNGSLNNIGANGNYWTSTPNATNTNNGSNLNFNNSNVNPNNNNNRANGNCVGRSRRLLNEELKTYEILCYDSPP